MEHPDAPGPEPDPPRTPGNSLEPIRYAEVRVRQPSLEDLATALAFTPRPDIEGRPGFDSNADDAYLPPLPPESSTAPPPPGFSRGITQRARQNGHPPAGEPPSPGTNGHSPPTFQRPPAAPAPIAPPVAPPTPRTRTTATVASSGPPGPPIPPIPTVPPVSAPPSPPPAPPPPPPPPPSGASDPMASGPDPSVLRSDGRLFRATPPRSDFEPNGRFTPIRRILSTLLRQRRRLVLSLLAIALGVGYLSGSLSLLSRVSAGLDAQVGSGSEVADLVIEGPIAFDSPLEQVRAQVSDQLRVAIAKYPGVAATEPRLEGNATILRKDGTPLVSSGLTERPVGANWPADNRLNPYTVVEGRGPQGPNEVVIDTNAARNAGYVVGDQVSVVTSQRRETFELVGLVRLGANDLPSGSTTALFRIDVARKMLGQATDDQSIAIALQPGVDVEQTRAELQQLVGIADVSNRSTYEDHRRLALAKSFTLIRILLIGFAGLTLTVGCFTVANSMALLFDQRRRGFALLRLIGANPRQITTAALIEAGIVGTAAAVPGVLFGFAVSWGIERTLGVLGTAVPTSGPVITWWVVPIAVLVGLVVTVSVSITPARQAARTSALNAVTGASDIALDNSGRLVKWAIGTGIGAAAGAAIGWLVAGAPIAAAIGAAAGAAVALAIGVVPLILQFLVGGVTRIAIGSSAALRSLSAQRSRQAKTRVAATAAALLFAAFVVSGLAVLSASLVASLDSQVQDTVIADLVVDSGTFTRGSLPVELLDQLGSDPQVSAVSGFRYAQLGVGSSSVRAVGLDGTAIGKVLQLKPIAGQLDTLSPESIAVSSDVAAAEHLQVGTPVTVTFGPNGAQSLIVSAIFPNDVTLVGGAIIDRKVLVAQVPASVDIIALVKLAPGGTADHVRQVASADGVGTVLPPAEFIGNRANLLRGFVRVVEWMLLFSVILATIGVANTLQLSVNERRRELGLLRAVGASRQQVLRLVLAEAAGLSVVGSVLGIVAGTGAAFATQKALAGFGLSAFDAPVTTLALIVSAAAILGLGASILPAWRASRTEPLEAIAASDSAESARGSRRRKVASRSDDSSPSLGTSALKRGRNHRDTTATEARPEGVSEDEMAARCYNCGNDPGHGEICRICGASQIPEPLGMFSTRPTLEADEQPGDPLADSRNGNGNGNGNGAGSANGNGNGHGNGQPAAAAAAARAESSTLIGEAPSASRANPDAVPRSDLWSVGVDDAPAPPPPPPSAPVTARHDIVDAAIIEDGPEIILPPQPPPPPSDPVWAARDAAPRPSSASQWGDPPPTQLRSPFGRTAADAGPPTNGATPHGDPTSQGANGRTSEPRSNDPYPADDRPPEVTVPTSPFGTQDPDDSWVDAKAPISPGAGEFDGRNPPQGYQPIGAAEAAAGSAYGAIPAGTFPQQYPQGYLPPAAVAPQPNPYAAAPTGAYPPGPGWTPAYPPPAVAPMPPIAMPDVHGVAAAMSRLGPRAHQLGVVPIAVAGGLLGSDEVAVSIVVGTNAGVPATVVLTSGRVLVVTDRRWIPQVEIFQLRSGLAVQGRHLGEIASLSIGEGSRGITVDEISDVAVAVEMATMIRSRCTTPTGF